MSSSDGSIGSGRTPMPTIDQVLVRLEPLARALACRASAGPAGRPFRSAACEGSRSTGCRRMRTRPNGPTSIQQFFALSGAHSTPPHLPAIGLEEQGYHLVRQGLPILASADHVEVPGGVLRPLVDPIPLYAWSMAWRRGSAGEGITALRDAAAELGTAEDWLRDAGDRDATRRGCPSPMRHASTAGGSDCSEHDRRFHAG